MLRCGRAIRLPSEERRLRILTGVDPRDDLG